MLPRWRGRGGWTPEAAAGWQGIVRGARTSGGGGLYDARTDAGQAGQPSGVSAVVCWILRCEGGRGRGRTNVGGHSGRVWVGYREGRGRTQREVEDRAARRRPRGRLAGCPPLAQEFHRQVARVCTVSIHGAMMMTGGSLRRKRSWLLPRKLVLCIPTSITGHFLHVFSHCNYLNSA